MIKEHNVEAVLMVFSETSHLQYVFTLETGMIRVGFVYSTFGAKGNNHVL